MHAYFLDQVNSTNTDHYADEDSVMSCIHILSEPAIVFHNCNVPENIMSQSVPSNIGSVYNILLSWLNSLLSMHIYYIL